MTVTREIGGQTWHVCAAHYPTAQMAKRAWERCEKKMMPGADNFGCSILRLGPNPDPAIPSGAPSGAHVVVAVAPDERMIRRAQWLLRDGGQFQPTLGFADTIIRRRMRMMTGRHAYQMTHQRGGGVAIIRREDDAGVRIYETGATSEPKEQT